MEKQMIEQQLEEAQLAEYTKVKEEEYKEGQKEFQTRRAIASPLTLKFRLA
jgi:hypothetical protein